MGLVDDVRRSPFEIGAVASASVFETGEVVVGLLIFETDVGFSPGDIGLLWFSVGGISFEGAAASLAGLGGD